jgi:hypothetical protein
MLCPNVTLRSARVALCAFCGLAVLLAGVAAQQQDSVPPKSQNTKEESMKSDVKELKEQVALLKKELAELKTKQVGSDTRVIGLSNYLHQISEKGIVGEPKTLNPYISNKAESDGIIIATTGGAPKSIELKLDIGTPGGASVGTRATHGASGLYASVSGIVRKGSTSFVDTVNAQGQRIVEPQCVTVWFIPITIPPPPAAEKTGKK